MNNKENFIVKTADWTMEVYVDEDIFDDPYVEACTRSIEIMQTNLEEDQDFLVNPVMVVKSLKRKNGKFKVINTYKILINAAMYDKAEALREIFFSNTQVDLAKEPLTNK